ncbi:G-protein coupled receptor GRL101-like [Amphiura filiformis]|uniref:G-protein coupled receptor GRL101-like n=1 Tax=Amphiura filiformis TaxID=82378 RepID=UPI003B22442C
MWVLGISALVGNLFSVIWRLAEKTRNQTQAIQTFLIGNLALADFFMGIYMLILASADIYYGDGYFNYSDEWRSGYVCRFAGFLSLFASEGSVFFLTLISYERFLGGVFPFSSARLTKGSAKTVGALLWLFTFVLSLVPVLLAGPDSDFYDLSDVCIGLPLITRPATFEFEASDVGNELTFDLPVSQDSKPAWYFSIVIFLGVNLVCFVFILICYIAIFWSLKKSMAKSGRSTDTQEEMKIAIKMGIIVGTDFLCWVPVIIMGILSQTELVVIPLEAYTWSVVFVLPINSSLNPYLYTISSLISDWRSKHPSKKKQKLTESSMGSSTKNESKETLSSSISQTTITK